jgi:hypothetical protein
MDRIFKMDRIHMAPIIQPQVAPPAFAYPVLRGWIQYSSRDALSNAVVGESPGGISPPGARRTVRERLRSPFSMTGAISQDRQSCQFPFLLDEKPSVVPVSSDGERSGGARKVLYGAARLKSGREALPAWAGKRFSAPQIGWNKSTAADARGGARFGRPTIAYPDGSPFSRS